MNTPDTPSFERAFSRLEEILDKMNSGSLTLDESILLYEEADKLIQFCSQKLTQAETKIEMLIKNREGDVALNPSGKPLTEPFSPSTSSTLRG